MTTNPLDLSRPTPNLIANPGAVPTPWADGLLPSEGPSRVSEERPAAAAFRPLSLPTPPGPWPPTRARRAAGSAGAGAAGRAPTRRARPAGLPWCGPPPPVAGRPCSDGPATTLASGVRGGGGSGRAAGSHLRPNTVTATGQAGVQGAPLPPPPLDRSSRYTLRSPKGSMVNSK